MPAGRCRRRAPDVRLGADPEPFATLGSVEFSTLLVEGRGRGLAGTGFGERGEGYVRIALVENEQRIRQAAATSAAFLKPLRKSCTTSSLASGAERAALRKPTTHGSPLKLGIAGLGTVGASVVRMIERQRDALAACGRPIEVVAVTARSRSKKRH